MKHTGFLALLSAILVLACGTGSNTTVTPVETAPPPVVQSTAPVEPPPQAAETPKQPDPAPQITRTETPAQSAPPEKVFDPTTITHEKFSITKANVQTLIEDLNRIIRAKNYNAWVGYLAESYFLEISSRAFLDEKTEELYRRDQTVASNLGRDPRRVQKKILRTARDYFDNVVVPSRSNDRMDDISFVGDDRVKAYTVDNRGQRLVLYDLENIDDKWKIIN